MDDAPLDDLDLHDLDLEDDEDEDDDEGHERLAALVALVREPPVPLAAEAAEVAGCVLGGQLVDLLRWLAPKRRVSSQGCLPRADLAEAAALVGEETVYVHPRVPGQLSMWDLHRLPQAWEALVAAGLLDVGASVARVTPLGLAVLADPEASAPALAGALASAVEAVLAEPDGGVEWLRPDPWTALPLLEEVAVEGRADADVVASLRYAWVENVVVELVDRGVLCQGGDGSLEVLPGLRRPLAVAVLRGDAERAGLVTTPEEDPYLLPVLEGAAMRLRSALLHSDPPVRREVLVPAGVRVGQLHDVLQAVMAWDDSHGHGFLRRAASFKLPVRASLPVRMLLKGARDRLFYVYDPGDSWIHEVSLVEMTTADVTDLPRCVAAEGRAPDEDSGGVSGWTSLVRAAMDAKSPGHLEARDWLGLDDDDPMFDPAVADLAAADARLEWLRPVHP